MQIRLVLSLLFALLVALFAVQNAQEITVSFLKSEWRLSVVVVVLASAALGALSAGLAGGVRFVSTQLRLRQMQAQLKKLTERNEVLETSATDLDAQITVLEEKLSALDKVPHAKSEDGGEGDAVS